MAKQQGHSFKAILNRGDEHSQSYVKAEVRGTALAEFFEKHLPPSPAARVLDLGCGSGLISFALSSRYGSVFAVDQEADNLEITSQGLAARSITNVHPVRVTGFQLPFPDGFFDGLVLNGVLEWVGVNNRGESAAELQKRFLAEVRRVLRPGGVFYIAIENRSAPRNLLRDPHTNIPLVCLFPRGMAEWFSRTFMGRAYQVYIYTPWQLRRLLQQAGFEAVRLFSPVPGYHYPFLYVSADNAQASADDLAGADFERLRRLGSQAGLKLDPVAIKQKLQFRNRLNLLALMSGDLAAISHRR